MTDGVRLRRRPLWVVVTVASVALLLTPIVIVAIGALTPSVDAWRQLWAGPLPGMIVTTFVVLFSVALGTLVLGAGLAWLVTAYDFRGARFFSWALVLPLAMPAYILGFVFLALLDFPGPVQTALRSIFGPDVWFPEVRSVLGVALVMSLTLYPYVFVLARAALREQAPSSFETARLLGDGRLRAARRVVLPLARPALAAGLVVVMMETLTDFATVQYFNVDTVSVGIYQVWRGMFDRNVAIELAGLVLAVALVVIALERLFRGPVRFYQRGGARDFERGVLKGWKAFGAVAVCGGVLSFAVLVPVAQLTFWVFSTSNLDLSRAFGYVGNSMGVALVAGLGCVAVAMVVASGARLSKSVLARRAGHLATVGYALPGPVVAIGVLTIVGGAVTALDVGSDGIVILSLFGLVYAYMVRFMAVAYGAVDASLESITPSVVDAAHTLGSGPAKVLRSVHFPMARAGAVAGLVLVMVDVLKELPIMLLIRPFGFTTASVWVWERAAESRWAEAAIPALLIVLVAMIPVVFYLRRGKHDDVHFRHHDPSLPLYADELVPV